MGNFLAGLQAYGPMRLFVDAKFGTKEFAKRISFQDANSEELIDSNNIAKKKETSSPEQ